MHSKQLASALLLVTPENWRRTAKIVTEWGEPGGLRAGCAMSPNVMIETRLKTGRSEDRKVGEDKVQQGHVAQKRTGKEDDVIGHKFNLESSKPAVAGLSRKFSRKQSICSQLHTNKSLGSRNKC